MAKYLVTGGAGFIGSNIVKKLLSQGHEAVVLDNFSGGKYPDRICAKAKYIKGDIRNSKDLKKALAGVKGVFHLAAVPRVPYSVEHPLETNDVNINGSLQVLISARDAGVKRVVYSSSSSVYGLQTVLPFTEGLKSRPMSPYGLQKFVAEEYCRLFPELYGLETVSLRYFNVYGPLMKFNGPYSLVIAKFFAQKQAGKPLTITGDGKYSRDFTHVSDVVRANMVAMSSSSVGRGEAINIGFGKSRSVMDLAKMVGGKITFIPERKGDPKRTEADVSLAKKLLGWRPKISLEEGIEQIKRSGGLS